MTLTSAFQFVPEQSTAALIVHHPEAKYYAVRGAATSEPSAISQQPAPQPAAGESAA
jgi:5-methyltetrahydrofolate--homocysteine methyltransferase